MPDKIIHSGELFDLGIGSINNKFGGKHILYVMKNGIYFTLQKFIDELSMIINTSGTDDKSEKRKLRLNFLIRCNQFPEIRKLFQNFTGELNGGNQFAANDILITVVGGNIFTLFAKILAYIGKNNSMTETTEKILNRYKYVGQGTLVKDAAFSVNLDTIIQNINDPELKKYIEQISKHDYSDFDYKLSPGTITGKEQNIYVKFNNLTPSQIGRFPTIRPW